MTAIYENQAFSLKLLVQETERGIEAFSVNRRSILQSQVMAWFVPGQGNFFSAAKNRIYMLPVLNGIFAVA